MDNKFGMNTNIRNLIWTEKYRPTTIEDYIFPEDFTDPDIRLLKKYCSDKYIDSNYLFFGKGGVGKTTLANILLNSIIQGNDRTAFMKVTGRGVDDIDKIKTFYKSRPINPKNKVKLVIIEEADRLSQKAITELKNIIEDANRYSTFFIAITNFPERIVKADRAFISRFISKRFSKVSPKRVFEFFKKKIVPGENITLSPDTEQYIEKLIEQLVVYRDFSVREILLYLQNIKNILGADWSDLEKLKRVDEQLFNSSIDFTKSAPDYEIKVFKLIEQFQRVLFTIQNPKLLTIFLFSVNPMEDLSKVKFKNPAYQQQVEQLISLYKKISDALDDYYSFIDFRRLFEVIKENNRNPFISPIIDKYLVNVEYAINPILSVQSFLYEIVKIKFETLLTINDLTYTEVEKVWKEIRGKLNS
jgi:hypothetical protein